MGCCGGKEDTEKEKQRKLLEAAAEKERQQKQKLLDGPLVAANNRPTGTHRDRIIALFAKYEKENLPLIDPWMEKLAGPRRAEYFIKEFCLKRDCSEPKSKQESMKECLTKHFAEKEQAASSPKKESNSAANSDKPPSAAVLKKVEETMKLYTKITPAEEGKFFEGIFGPGDKKRMEEEHNDADLVPSSSFAAGEALQRSAQEILDRIAMEEAAEEEIKNKNKIKKKREKRPCTCDEELKERIMAMMIDHCPERLDSIVEEEHYYDSEAGAELLYSLIEEFGEEPESKQAAVTACYRRLLQEHDPQRLKSLPTMVAAAMAASSIKVKQARQKSGNNYQSHEKNEDDEDEEIELNGVQQAVAKVLKTYGVARPTKTANEQHAGGFGGASLLKQSSNSHNNNSNAPAFIVPSHSSTSTYYDADSSSSSYPNFGNNNNNNYSLPLTRRFPPQEMRGHHFVAPYMTSMDGEVQRSFSAVPVPNHHKLISNYEKARLLLDTLPPQQQQNINNNYYHDKHSSDFSNNNNNNKKSAVEEMLDDLMTHDQENNNNNNVAKSQNQTLASSSTNNSTVVVQLQELEEKLHKDNFRKSAVKRILENGSSSSDDDSGNDHEGEKDEDVNLTVKKRKNIFNPEVETVRHRRNIVLHDDVIRPAGPPLMHHRRDAGNETETRKPAVKQNPLSQNNNNDDNNNQNVAATIKSTAAADSHEPVVSSADAAPAAASDQVEGEGKENNNNNNNNAKQNNNDNSLEGTPQKQVPNYAAADEIDFDL